jgi:CYTH domain-containing protein
MSAVEMRVMAQEIERKFLVVDESWRAMSRGPRRIRQGYITRGPTAVVRIRTFGERGFLTIKNAAAGLIRSEFEHEIPFAEAEELLRWACGGHLIEKTRHKIAWEGLDWVIDEFAGALSGLVLAEIELHYADQSVPLPPWVGREVTDDPTYGNSSLSLAPP